MSTIGNTPGVSSQRFVQREVIAGSSKAAFVVTTGYSLGYVDVHLNGSQLDESDFTAADGVNVILAQAAAVGDIVRIIAWLPRGLSDGYLKSEADAKYLSSANGSVTQAKLAANVAGNGPAFSAYLSGSNQNITTGVVTLVALNAEEFDTNSRFNNTGSAVNGIPAYSFMPDVAGYYQVNAAIFHNGSGYSANIQTSINKNGSDVKRSAVVYNTAIADGSVCVSALIYLNGTTDYINMYGFNSQPTPYFTQSVVYTYLQAFLARSAT